MFPMELQFRLWDFERPCFQEVKWVDNNVCVASKWNINLFNGRYFIVEADLWVDVSIGFTALFVFV